MERVPALAMMKLVGERAWPLYALFLLLWVGFLLCSLPFSFHNSTRTVQAQGSRLKTQTAVADSQGVPIPNPQGGDPARPRLSQGLTPPTPHVSSATQMWLWGPPLGPCFQREGRSRCMGLRKGETPQDGLITHLNLHSGRIPGGSRI